MGWRLEWDLNVGGRLYESFSTTGQYQHDIWRLLRPLYSEGLPSLWHACLYLLAFGKVAARELYAFATADTCDGSFAALFFGALCAYLLITRRRDRQREIESAKGPPIRVSPALAGEAFWEKYEKARGWQSNIARSDKSSQLVGGKNPYSRPLDALLPRREYVPKRRAWEGSGTASIEGAPAPLLRGQTQSPAWPGLQQLSEQQDLVKDHGLASGEGGTLSGNEGDKVKKAVDWERTRRSAILTAEVWAEEQPYQEWIVTYTKSFKTPGSLAASGMLLEPLGTRHGLQEVNRQFYRDVTSGGIIRLQNRPVPCRGAVEAAVKKAKKRLKAERLPAADISDTYEHHVARFAWDGLLRAAGGNAQLASEISAVANQNLGIACYEHVVNHFSPGGDGSDEPLAVLQTGEHFLNIWQEGRKNDAPVLKVRFEGLFKVVPFSLLDGLGVDPLDAALARAVAAVAELEVPLGTTVAAAGTSGLVRFAIHAPVRVEVVPEHLVLVAEVDSEEVQEVWVRDWLDAKLELGTGIPQAASAPAGSSQRLRDQCGSGPGMPLQEEAERMSEDGRNLCGDVREDGNGGGGDLDACTSSAGRGPTWGAGKVRLLARLMAEGFSFEASLRAIVALSADAGAIPAGASAATEPSGARVANKSTATLIDCLLWLCERLGDSAINDPPDPDELHRFNLSQALLLHLRSQAAAALSCSNDDSAGEAKCIEGSRTAACARGGEGEAARRTPTSPHPLPSCTTVVTLADRRGEEGRGGEGEEAVPCEQSILVAPVPTDRSDPWRVLEKASEAAAAAAAKKLREEALLKRRAQAQQKGFNKGYKS